jgi:acetyl esterase/lipase
MMARSIRTALVASLLCALAACGHRVPATSPESGPPAPALSISGDPESGLGARWTLVGTLNGTPVNVRGILLKPRGAGRFPAVVLSHGAGGNAQTYGRAIGSEMRAWGLVCIAVDYTHAAGAAAGTLLELGASAQNVFRAHAAFTVLARLPYVDLQRVAAHGHSMGAFVTTAFVAHTRRMSEWRRTRPAASCSMLSTGKACRSRALSRRGASAHHISGTTPSWTTRFHSCSPDASTLS